jgi:hypothetical protein
MRVEKNLDWSKSNKNGSSRIITGKSFWSMALRRRLFCRRRLQNAIPNATKPGNRNRACHPAQYKIVGALLWLL